MSRTSSEPVAREGLRPQPVIVVPRGQDVEDALYEVRQKVYPRAVHGWFSAWRWAIVWATQVVFFGGPWLTWNGRQAVLFDIAARKFYIFGLVFWPQDIFYLTILLILSALALFLFTAVAGRLWCGYACPQTVYTEIFLWMERRIEGERAQRMRLDHGPLGWRKVALKTAKHAAWIAFALWTGLTFVGYFTPVQDLLARLAGLSLGPWEGFWILFYGFMTYGNAGWLREQVCKYMCPYARFQSAMFDPDTLTISYDARRGDPRGSRVRSVNARAAGLGDCIDCGLCVQVCPTGIDIRNGLQNECIGCAACIDACDRVMKKMRRAPGLIRYATARGLEEGLSRRQIFARVLRPRVLAYTAIILAISAATAAALYVRVPLKVDVLRDRAALAREVEGGAIENVYRLQVMNTTETPRVLQVRASGLDTLSVAGQDRLALGAAETRTFPVRLRVQQGTTAPGTHDIAFHVSVLDHPEIAVRERSVFIAR